jgi:hypothetical protein
VGVARDRSEPLSHHVVDADVPALELEFVLRQQDLLRDCESIKTRLQGSTGDPLSVA